MNPTRSIFPLALSLPGPMEILFIVGVLFFGTIVISIALWIARRSQNRRPPSR